MADLIEGHKTKGLKKKTNPPREKTNLGITLLNYPSLKLTVCLPLKILEKGLEDDSFPFGARVIFFLNGLCY